VLCVVALLGGAASASDVELMGRHHHWQHDESSNSTMVVVNGHGVTQVDATLTNLVVTVTSTGTLARASDVQQATSARTNSVISALNGLSSVQGLRTTGVTLQPVYNYSSSDNGPVMIGYRASNSLGCRVALSDTGSAIDAAVRAGATSVDTSSFTTDDDTLTQAQATAVQLATADAMRKATAAITSAFPTLDTTNATSTRVRIMKINPGQGQQWAMAPGAAMDRGVATPVIGGPLVRTH
jgi:uncharacterized protein YggE